MNAYKINELSSVNTINKIHVFYGSHDKNLEELFASDPHNDIFSGIFTQRELGTISKLKIPVIFS